MDDYISREAAIENFTQYTWYDEWGSPISDSDEQRKILREMFADIPAADVRPVPPGGIGEMSDGYHTFNGLYYQRMVLFAALVKQNKDSAWKSHRHEDGELCFGGGWFIVGIDTPDGSYTYHYEDKDWDLFDCEELPVGKHWDGHTEDDVTRLLSLPEVRPVWIPVTERLPEETGSYLVWMRWGDYESPVYSIINFDKDCEAFGEWEEYNDPVSFGWAGSDFIEIENVYAWMPLPDPPNCGADMREVDHFRDATKKDYHCADCRWSPPSSCDGKPCCACEPDIPGLNCYERKEDTP